MKIDKSYRDIVCPAIAEMVQDSPPSRVMSTVAESMNEHYWEQLRESADSDIDRPLRPYEGALGRWAQRMVNQLAAHEKFARDYAMQGQSVPPVNFRAVYEDTLERLIDQLGA